MKTKYFMKFILYMFFLMAACSVNAQDVLTVQEAIAIALENNYDIKLAQNDLEIDEQNVSLANAGIMPQLSGVFDQNNAIQNSRQVRADGTVQELDNAKNNSNFLCLPV